MTYVLKCADFLSLECAEEITGESADEVLEKAKLHAAEVHGDINLTPDRIENAQYRTLVR
jgi:predicted small metal-binding protein